jgi:hypothetical protein
MFFTYIYILLIIYYTVGVIFFGFYSVKNKKKSIDNRVSEFVIDNSLTENLISE